MKSKAVLLLPVGILLAAQLACGGGPSTPAPVAGASDKNMACIMAQDFMEDQLKAPATAKFARCSRDSATFEGDGEFIVTSYVDAQNGFGAMIRTTFVMRVKSVGDDKWKMLEVATEP